MKTILGLDLGVASVGWALTRENDDQKEILGMGSRIIPLSPDDRDEFTKGNAISKNQARTLKRTLRKGFDRYQLRRKYLSEELRRFGMLPRPELFSLSAIELYGLRVKALKEQISLQELGRICLHLNQKRGYKSSRSDSNLDKKETEYVGNIKSRYEAIKEAGLTVGAYLFAELSRDPQFRVKDKVFPREAYIEEFNRICDTQMKYYPEVLTLEIVSRVRDEIIYYQRPLKSQKGLVSVCEFEGFEKENSRGKTVFVGPKVAPRSSPLFQVCKIWESINSIRIQKHGWDPLQITLEDKQRIFDYLDMHERISVTELFKILRIKKEDGWVANKQLEKGIQGNLTKAKLIKCFEDESVLTPLLRFDLLIKETGKEISIVDSGTGEIIGMQRQKIVDPAFENEPFYRLWHAVYSVAEKEDLVNVLQEQFQIPQHVAEKILKLDFTQGGYGNKSAKAMRKILPYLTEGLVYSEACAEAGYNHSNSMTSSENEQRILLNRLPLLAKNSLRQPVVEKILNQMIHVVNGICDQFGKPDEIRIELARNLKQSREERNDDYKRNSERERVNDQIASRLQAEYGLRATRNNIIKWKLFQEINNHESSLNAVCIYCGQPFGITQALKGAEVDIEHIIPRSRLFDDSMNNKTLSHRKCNQEKGNLTAYDYMKTKSDADFQGFLDRVNEVKNQIKKAKLLMPGDKIPMDFIDRQLRQTQYISRKSLEILSQISRNVNATSGSVTEYLRRTWGWNDVTMNLVIKRIKQAGLDDQVELYEVQDGTGNLKVKERIKGWSKRDDHRHHAIDALVIACTSRGYIQRLNTLNAEFTKLEKQDQNADSGYSDQRTSLETFFQQNRPFTTHQVEEVVSSILVSFKAGKKVATTGRRLIKKHGKKEIVQSGIIVPRGPLSEESVYGKIKTIQREVPLKKLFEIPDLIVKPQIRTLIEKRLQQHENDPAKAYKSCKKEPLFLDPESTVILGYASVFKEEVVIKYPISALKINDLPAIVDPAIRKVIAERLESYGNNPKEAFKDLENNPVYFNAEKRIPVQTVRLFTGLSAVEPVKKDQDGREIGFVKPGNNHHIAIYRDADGVLTEQNVTFWHALERKKFGFPVIIRDPNAAWDRVSQTKTEYPEPFLASLPDPRWGFIISIQQNEMFLFGLEAKDLNGTDPKDLANMLYRVQKISKGDYWFRVHSETANDQTSSARDQKKFIRCQSLKVFFELSPLKVRIDILGRITGSAN